jgi:hypothetical protein
MELSVVSRQTTCFAGQNSAKTHFCGTGRELPSLRPQ